MKQYFTFLFLLCASTLLYAANINTVNSGYWNNASNWSSDPTLPATGDNLQLNHDLTIDNDITFDFNSVTINSDGSLIINGNLILTNNCALTLNGPITVTGNITLASNASITINSGGTLTVDGSINSDGNSLSLTNYDDLRVGGDLILENGSNFINSTAKIITIGNNLILDNSSITNNGTLAANSTIALYNTSSVTNNSTVTSNVQKDASSTWSGTLPEGGLPIKLTHFEAQYKRNTLYITWSTASEENNQKFIIQLSHNGFDFFTEQEIEGAGNSSTTQHYETKIPILNSSEILYIRLQQQDYDGTLKTEKIIAARIWNNLTLYPNTVIRGEQIHLNTQINGYVTDYSGKKIMNICNTDKIEIDNLQKGIYYIIANNTRKKFIVR